MTKEEILAKARIDYPIGTIVNPVYLPKSNNTIANDEFVWKEGADGLGLCVKVKEKVSSDSNMVAIYNPKKGFSTIISKPEQQTNIMEEKKTEFKAGDYIVTLKVTLSDTACGKNNYCFKQKINSSYITPVKDLGGSTNNANTTLKFDKSNELKDWRYANEAEIAEYERIDKPYDVSTLVKKYDYEVAHCTTQEEIDFVISKCQSKSSRLYKDGLSLTKELKDYPEGIAINHKENCYGRLDWYKEQTNYKIISFSEWCKKFNYTPDFIKPIQKWSVGSYGVLLRDSNTYYDFKKGFIDKITKFTGNEIVHFEKFCSYDIVDLSFQGGDEFKWFATLQEAEIFSRSLLDKSEIPEYVECIKSDSGVEVGKIYIVQLEKGFKYQDNTTDVYYISDRPYYQKSFIPSTKEAYENQFKQNPLTPKEYNMQDIIEIGDEIELIATPHAGYDIGDRCIIQEVYNYNDFAVFRKNTKEIVGDCNFKGHWKLIKKAQTTNSIKKVLSSLPEIRTNKITVKQAVKLTSNVIINIKPISNNVKVQINEQKYKAKKVIISKTTIKI